MNWGSEKIEINVNNDKRKKIGSSRRRSRRIERERERERSEQHQFCSAMHIAKSQTIFFDIVFFVKLNSSYCQSATDAHNAHFFRFSRCCSSFWSSVSESIFPLGYLLLAFASVCLNVQCIIIICVSSVQKYCMKNVLRAPTTRLSIISNGFFSCHLATILIRAMCSSRLKSECALMRPRKDKKRKEENNNSFSRFDVSINCGRAYTSVWCTHYCYVIRSGLLCSALCV